MSTGAFPVVTTVSKGSTTITFIGTDFMQDGYTSSATFAGFTATTVEFTDPFTLVAVWAKGVPISNDATTPGLTFLETATKIVYAA